MKSIRPLLMLTLVIAGYIANAQTLEKKYLSSNMSYFKYSDTEDGYVEFNQSTKVVSIFNINHQLLKSIQLSSSVGIYLVSKTLINNNGKFKLVIATSNKVSIIDEDNNILFTRDSAAIAKFANTTSGPKMTLLSTTGGWSEVYSLPGSIVLMTKAPKSEQNDIDIYPNPSSNRFMVRIDNPIYENVVFSIVLYDLNGKAYQIENKTIINGEFEIGTTGLPHGEYILELLSNGITTRTQKVIIE